MKHVKLSTSTIQRMATLFILLTIMVVLSCVSDKYLNARNLMNIIRQESTLIIIASAATLLMISGGMDLSPAGVIALTSVCGWSESSCSDCRFAADRSPGRSI